jgi:DNA-binding NtrC family response regulator
MARILVVDDEQHLCGALKLLLELEGYEVMTANDGLAAFEIVTLQKIDLVMTDVRMPRMDGIQLLKKVHEIYPLIPVIVMTAYANLKDGIQAMKDGAYHYLMKPFENDEVKLQVKKALEEQRLRSELAYLRDELDQKYPFKNIVGRSEAMQQVFELIRRVAPSKSTVLITGESGTGKELVSRAIHDNSPRRDKAMIKVNCVAIPDTLLESELFGHVKGAFTDATYTKPGKFELADGGTIFLDEIGDMSLSLQGKILRVLQEREYEPVGGTSTKQVDVRVIAATNRPLKKLVQENQFREDLYFRLNVVPIQVPPLRNRKEDIPELVQFFLQKDTRETGKKIDKISREAVTLLEEYAYPGNVRELENMIERAVVLCQKSELDVQDFQFNVSDSPRVQTIQEPLSALAYREAKQLVLENFERKFFTDALIFARGNISKAAERVGMHRKNFYEKLNQYKIDSQEFIREEEDLNQNEE